MNKKLITVISIMGALLSGCASQPSSTFEAFQAPDLNPLISSGQFAQKVDNFFVINDSSYSMADTYVGPGYTAQPTPTKFSVEKEILSRINQTIPNIKLTTNIRSFGFGSCLSNSFTKLNQPATDYSKASFSSGIDALTCASGGSPLDEGIIGTNTDLSPTAGNIAVLVLSDGHDLDSDGVKATKALKQKYGDRLCIYTVWVGNQEEQSGKILLGNLSNIAGCGFGTSAERLATSDAMGKFVQTVFLKATPKIADCSTLDSDGDGINDCNDKCPGTLSGAPVNKYGCWIVDVKFDNDKSVIKSQYHAQLNETAAAIISHPHVKIEVQGHTSNTGTAEHNMELSERRAIAVRDYLIKTTNMSPGSDVSQRLTARGYGLTRPIDTNDTEEGRANNRRVQLDIIRK